MRIVELTAMIVRLRLRKEFKHASFHRNASSNFVVRCRLSDGTVGWGEGIPRTYVTGESATGAMEQIATTDLTEQLSNDCHDWSDVIDICRGYSPAILQEDPRGCLANAHRCAVELSILDAFGRLFESPLHTVTQYLAAESVDVKPIYERSHRVQYSSAISSGGMRKESLSSLAMRIYGFRHCKVKVGMDSDRDGRRLKRMRRIVGRHMDLRVDANEAWEIDEVVRRIHELEPAAISCVEQPVRHGDVAALSQIRSEITVPLMLDESLTSQQDAEIAIQTGTCDLFNIRLSKCGGFLNSVRLAAMAHTAGLGYQLGCHPGESGILSAAGRHFVTSVGDIRYREGSADRHLLKELITDEDLTFGYAGWAPEINRPGLGIDINEAKLKPLIQSSQTLRVS